MDSHSMDTWYVGQADLFCITSNLAMALFHNSARLYFTTCLSHNVIKQSQNDDPTMLQRLQSTMPTVYIQCRNSTKALCLWHNHCRSRQATSQRSKSSPNDFCLQWLQEMQSPLSPGHWIQHIQNARWYCCSWLCSFHAPSLDLTHCHAKSSDGMSNINFQCLYCCWHCVHISHFLWALWTVFVLGKVLVSK